MIIEYRDVDHEDERGTITDVMRTPSDAVTLVMSKAGSVRGNHYHKKATIRVFVLNGEFKVFSRFRGVEQEFLAKAGNLLTFLPYDLHALVALEDSTFLILTHGFRGGEWTVQEKLT